MTSRGRRGRFQTELKPIGDWLMDIIKDAPSTPSPDSRPKHPCDEGCQYAKDVGMWPQHSCGNGCVYDKHKPDSRPADDVAGLIERLNKATEALSSGPIDTPEKTWMVLGAVTKAAAALSRLRAEVESANNVNLFDKACLAGEIRLTQAAVTRALAAEADNKRLREALEQIQDKAREWEGLSISEIADDIDALATAALAGGQHGQ